VTWVALVPILSAGQDVAIDPETSSFYAEDERLRVYVNEALQHNPSVLEARARYQAIREKVPQVEGLPDPVLSFSQAIRPVETRVGPQLNVLQFSQKLPWFGKLDLEGKVILQEAEAQYQLYLAQQRAVIAEVKRAYYDLSYVDTALDITREEQLVLEHYEKLSQARYAGGQGLQQAVIKIQTEITQIVSRLDLLELQRASLEAKLNTLRDRPPQESIPRLDTPTLPGPAIDLEELYTLGEENRQELRAVEALMEKYERAIDLSEKSPWPDITLGAAFINVGRRGDPAGLEMPPSDNGKNAFSLSVGVTLPLWGGKYKAETREAAEGLSAERYKYSRIQNDVELQIRDSVVRLETLQRQLQLFDSALIPQAEEALRSTESAYETGQLGVLDLLDSERFLLELRLANARFRSDYLGALAALERAVGTRFPRS
jgi:outer membrane protein TolC